MLFFPVLDPDSLPAQPSDALAAADGPTQPLLIGWNRDEWNLFDAANIARWAEPLPHDALIDQACKRLPGATREQVARFADTYFASRKAHGLRDDARAVLRAIDGDLRFRMPSLRFAEAYTARAPVFVYQFEYRSPALRGVLGACHALDLPFVFGTLDARGQDRFAGNGAEPRALSETMMRTWLSFAVHGQPRHLPEWPAYDVVQRPTQIFDLAPHLALDPLGDERRAWDGLL